ncbi:RRP15-like protein [Ruditapes philippinarum]|uniref:RRP15-like protein n=1 Tax=Ruditapes philippinarum TaxID=129788 RepID=UPI00295A71DD|nr:RRP15-like protein [Ruditapes philippinarum]
MCRSKPDPLKRDKERQLQKIATRGVVQLFNAVRKQQKIVEDEIQQVGMSERKKDKIMEGMTKDKFLTLLKGTSKTNVKAEKPEESVPVTIKKEESDEEDDGDNVKSGKTWNILKDDYMMGAKMKDWDKEESDDDDASDDDDDPDLSDSD